MNLWTKHVVPRIADKGLAEKHTGEFRERVCADLSGDVLEIGFGSGLNAAHYPAAVTQVLAVEPSDLAWRMAEPRVAASSTTVKRVGLDGQSLPLEDASADTALSTWTLCTIPDAVQALREVRRVLKPGGTLHFIEHGRAPHDGVDKWQRRIEPVYKHIAGGCHLTRSIDDLVTSAGFTMERLDIYYAPKQPKPFARFYEGVARPA